MGEKQETFADIEAAQKREVGNGAKMREALLETTRQLEPIVKYMHPDKAEHIGLTTVFAACEPIYKIAKAALAEPRRNCDVGTPEEQAQRFNDYCMKQGDGCSIGKSKGACPMFKGYQVDCAIVWAQMPYEEEAKK